MNKSVFKINAYLEISKKKKSLITQSTVALMWILIKGVGFLFGVSLALPLPLRPKWCDPCLGLKLSVSFYYGKFQTLTALGGVWGLLLAWGGTFVTCCLFKLYFPFINSNEPHASSSRLELMNGAQQVMLRWMTLLMQPRVRVSLIYLA